MSLLCRSVLVAKSVHKKKSVVRRSATKEEGGEETKDVSTSSKVPKDIKDAMVLIHILARKIGTNELWTEEDQKSLQEWLIQRKDTCPALADSQQPHEIFQTVSAIIGAIVFIYQAFCKVKSMICQRTNRTSSPRSGQRHGDRSRYPGRTGDHCCGNRKGDLNTEDDQRRDSFAMDRDD